MRRRMRFLRHFQRILPFFFQTRELRFIRFAGCRNPWSYISIVGAAAQQRPRPIYLNAFCIMPHMPSLPVTLPAVYQIDENGDIALGGLCFYIIIILIVILIVAVLLYLYQNILSARREPRKHYCEHCGRTTIPASVCCYEPVREEYLRYVCTACGKPAKIICSDCRHLFG